MVDDSTDLHRLAAKFEELIRSMNTVAVQVSRWCALRAWLLTIWILHGLCCMAAFIWAERTWTALIQIPVFLMLLAAVFFTHRSVRILVMNVVKVQETIREAKVNHGEEDS